MGHVSPGPTLGDTLACDSQCQKYFYGTKAPILHHKRQPKVRIFTLLYLTTLVKSFSTMKLNNSNNMFFTLFCHKIYINVPFLEITAHLVKMIHPFVLLNTYSSSSLTMYQNFLYHGPLALDRAVTWKISKRHFFQDKIPSMW